LPAIFISPASFLFALHVKCRAIFGYKSPPARWRRSSMMTGLIFQEKVHTTILSD
jgi:hypothetical protein